MKKIQNKKGIISTILSISACCAIMLPASVTSVNAAPELALPPSIMGEINSQVGGNIKHDTDTMRYKYEDIKRDDDYRHYQRQRNQGSTGTQVIKNNTPQDSGYQATIEEMDTKGVYVNSIEVSPSEILTKEEINNIIQPLVGKNVFINDLQKAIDDINNLYAQKGFVTARAFLPELDGK